MHHDHTLITTIQINFKKTFQVIHLFEIMKFLCAVVVFSVLVAFSYGSDKKLARLEVSAVHMMIVFPFNTLFSFILVDMRWMTIELSSKGMH